MRMRYPINRDCAGILVTATVLATSLSWFNPGNFSLFVTKVSRGRLDSTNFAECKISWPGPIAGGDLPQPTLPQRSKRLVASMVYLQLF